MLKPSKNDSEYDRFEEHEKSDNNIKSPQINDGVLYDLALGYVIKHNEISINQLRKLTNVSFQRAKRIVSQLEKNNIIENYSGGGSSRSINVPKGKLHHGKENSSFNYVNHVLKLPGEIQIIEEDEL